MLVQAKCHEKGMMEWMMKCIFAYKIPSASSLATDAKHCAPPGLLPVQRTKTDQTIHNRGTLH